MASFCPNFNLFAKHIRQYNQAVEIEKDKDKALRYDVWGTTSEHVRDLFTKGVKSLPGKNNSKHVIGKIKNALERIEESTKSAAEFNKDIIQSDYNIEFSIALHELMESVKGEADKARNLGKEITAISSTGVLPSIPLSRVAASIGRKIAFQQGYRFKSQDVNPSTAAEIETLYYGIGKAALIGLEDSGYVNLEEGLGTIKDYIDASEIKKSKIKTGEVTDKVLSVSLNEDKLGIKAGSVEANYFLDRTEADLSNKTLGVIVDSLKVVRQITQPSTLVLPDTSPTQTDEQLAERDDQNITIDPKTKKTRKKLYEKPLYVHKTIHDLMTLLNKESMKTGKSGSKIVTEAFQGHQTLVNSLFGLKRSDNFSVDKKESVSGQNLSKTTPLDDLVEYYDVLQNGSTAPVPLHMALKIGRNARLYYENSVLNPHSSKQSRYMLTAGEYTVDTGTADFDYLVYSISQFLGDKKLTYDNFLGNTESKLDEALEIYAEYEADTSVKDKLASLSNLSVIFPGVDYVSLLTTMQAVKDIRNPSDGKVTTEFNVSADATASGGTLTFLQAIGTKPEVQEFLQQIGLFKRPEGVKPIDDLYSIMTNAIDDFIKGKRIKGLFGQKKGKVATGPRLLLKDTVDLLFDEGKATRQLSKDPTMTFVYGQGRKGAIETMSRSLADRIVDSLDNDSTREYLVRLTGKEEYANIDSKELKNVKGLYKEIVKKLSEGEDSLTGQMYDIMDAAINTKYLENYKQRSTDVFEFVKQLSPDSPVKILPAAAVLAGIKPTLANLKKYGMPITKIFEVSNKVPGDNADTVLTRRQKLTKTVMDVSTIHGIDAAQLYLSLDQTMSDNGVVVVHDDVRSTVQDVRAMEAKYRETTVEVIKNYDVHQQIMNAVAAYDEAIADSAGFKELMGTINEEVSTKKQLIEENFNEDTNALIGDGNAYVDFAKGEKAAEQKAPKTEVKVKTKKVKPKFSVLGTMTELASESDIITKFLELREKGVGSNVDTGNLNEFIPATDLITISGTDQGRGDTGKELDLTNPADRKLQKELIEHEITHANTVAYIVKAAEDKNSTAGKEIRYFKKAVDKLAALRVTLPEGTPGEVLDRITYIVTRKNEVEQVAEFVSIMNTEPETATAIYELFSETLTKSLKERIKDFVNKVVLSFSNVTEEDFAKDVDIEKLYAALANTVYTGESQRAQNYDETIKVLESYNDKFGAGTEKAQHAQRYLNEAVSSMINSRLERRGKKVLGNLHDILKGVFPMYTDVSNKLAGVYDESSALQQIMHTITGVGTDKTKKANILSQFARVMGQQREVTNDQMGKFNKILNPMDKEEKALIGRFVTEMPLHDYFVLADEFVTEEAIADEVVKLEKEVNKVSPNTVKDINGLIDWNVNHNEKAKSKIFNLESGETQMNGKLGESARKLLALKSIMAIGTKDFVNLLDNVDLINLLKDTSIANRLSLLNNSGTGLLPDSFIPDYYKESVRVKAVELSEFGMYENGENVGWEILEVPTENTLGIVYSKSIDSTVILGAYTDTKLSGTKDPVVSGKKAKYPGVVKTTTGHSLRLSHDQKVRMGLVEDFSQALVRGTAHNMAIQDSQGIRDELLKEDARIIIGKNQTKLLDIVESDNIDNPWFVKLEEGQLYSELDPKIRAKYEMVKGRASNVNNFNQEVDLVRKDISHWLLGDSSKSVFTNPKYKWMMRIVKDLIAGSKIGMVVMNPMKIAQDNISNISYLGVMGVPPLDIIKDYKNIAKDFQEYSDLQRQIVQLKIQHIAKPESKKLEKQINALRDRTKANKVGDLMEKGFINSLGSDLVAKNADTLSGLQADMHTALEYLLVNKTKDKDTGKVKENKRYLSHFILKLSDLGWHSEDFLTYLGGIVAHSKTGKGMQHELDTVAERLKEIRTEEDIVNYVSQYTNSPGSEAVRLGSSITDLTDVMAKETLYRHLVKNEGMSPEKARIKVLDSFPDYKENMPLAVKHLSDVGVIMFPSFWLRIQKVIYRMVRDKPINLATELMLEEALGSNVNTIMDANIINKHNTWGGLLHTPLEPIGVGSVVPTHLF